MFYFTGRGSSCRVVVRVSFNVLDQTRVINAISQKITSTSTIKTTQLPLLVLTRNPEYSANCPISAAIPHPSFKQYTLSHAHFSKVILSRHVAPSFDRCSCFFLILLYSTATSDYLTLADGKTANAKRYSARRVAVWPFGRIQRSHTSVSLPPLPPSPVLTQCGRGAQGMSGT